MGPVDVLPVELGGGALEAGRVVLNTSLGVLHRPGKDDARPGRRSVSIDVDSWGVRDGSDVAVPPRAVVVSA